MPLFEADPETKAIAIYSEPGGRMEAELAEWVKENDSRLPIVAFMAGRFMDEMPGMRFGHAGTIVEGKADTTADKIERMRAAGIAVAERIEEIPTLIQERLAERGPADAGHVHRRQGRRPRSRRTRRSPRSWSRSARSTSSPSTAAELRIVEENLDECVLCDLCVAGRSAGSVQVVKLYE